MSEEIKSAREIALARIEADGDKVTAEDRCRWRYVPEGERLAAQALSEKINLPGEINQADDKAKPYLKQGAIKVLLTNIILPTDAVSKQKSARALTLFAEISQEKEQVDEIVERINQLFEHYETHGNNQKQQAIEQLKQDFGRKLKQALRQQLGTSAAGMITDVENLPQFKEEKRRLVARFDSQYINLLNEYKKELEQNG
jgi:hypothetical protein